MQIPPFDVLSSWPTPNYVDPKDVRGPQLAIITSILFPIVLATVALRVCTRVFISKSFGADDWFLLAAVVPTAACTVLTILADQRWDWNRHIWDVPPEMVTLGLKLTIIMECTFAVAVSLTKISMLILTRRILTNGTGIMRRIAAFLIIIVAIDCLIFCFVVIFACSPVSAYWTLSETPQKCINERLHLVIGGTVNTLTDFGVVLLPLPTVFSLKINRRQQFIVCGLFGAGFIICVAGIFRIYFVYKTSSTFDRTWESYGLWISSVIELFIGVICTAIPACKPFFSRFLPKFFGTTLANSRPSQSLRSTTLSKSRTSHMPHVAFISQEKHFARSGSHEPFELQSIPKSKLYTRIIRSSSHYLPISKLITLEDSEKEVKRSLNATSISSFARAKPSLSSSHFVTAGPSAVRSGIHTSDSIDKLTEAQR